MDHSDADAVKAVVYSTAKETQEILRELKEAMVENAHEMKNLTQVLIERLTKNGANGNGAPWSGQSLLSAASLLLAVVGFGWGIFQFLTSQIETTTANANARIEAVEARLTSAIRDGRSANEAALGLASENRNALTKLDGAVERNRSDLSHHVDVQNEALQHTERLIAILWREAFKTPLPARDRWPRTGEEEDR